MKNTTKINTKEQINEMTASQIKASFVNIDRSLTEYAFSVYDSKKKTETSKDSVSQYFMKADESDYLIRNLSATASAFERHNSDFLKAEIVKNNNKKLTIKQFNSLMTKNSVQ